MKWYKHCAFCDLQFNFKPQRARWSDLIDQKATEHQSHCVFSKTLRAAEWSKNGLVVVLDARLAQLPTRE